MLFPVTGCYQYHISASSTLQKDVQKYESVFFPERSLVQDHLLKEGLAWLDSQAAGEAQYWLPALFSELASRDVSPEEASQMTPWETRAPAASVDKRRLAPWPDWFGTAGTARRTPSGGRYLDAKAGNVVLVGISMTFCACLMEKIGLSSSVRIGGLKRSSTCTDYLHVTDIVFFIYKLWKKSLILCHFLKFCQSQ